MLTPLVENCGKHVAWVIEVDDLRRNREALRGYFAVLKLGLLDKRLADLEQEWNRFDGQIKQLEARLQEQRIQVDELKQAINANGGDRLERLSAEIKKKEMLRDARLAKAQRYQELTAVLEEPAAPARSS